jgi:hypothetical protein
MQRRRFLLALAGTGHFVSAAVRGDKAMYVGGTVPGLQPKTDGKLDFSAESETVFTSKKGKLQIPYQKITSLEYGQKAGRRVGVAVAITIFALFSKKRRHYLTIGYDDAAGKRQGAVFELAKGTVRTVLTTLEARTGKQVEYESEEAKKNIGQ